MENKPEQNHSGENAYLEEPEDTSGKHSDRKRKRKFIKTIGGWIFYLVFVGMLFVGTPKALSIWLKTETPVAAITSHSMWPALKRGDLIFVRSVNKSEIEAGDIVVYKNIRGYTIHRVVSINKEKGTLITKGDANNVEDKPITIDEVVGRAVEYPNGKPFRLPKLGYLSIWFSKYGLQKNRS